MRNPPPLLNPPSEPYAPFPSSHLTHIFTICQYAHPSFPHTISLLSPLSTPTHLDSIVQLPLCLTLLLTRRFAPSLVRCRTPYKLLTLPLLIGTLRSVLYIYSSGITSLRPFITSIPPNTLKALHTIHLYSIHYSLSPSTSSGDLLLRLSYNLSIVQ